MRLPTPRGPVGDAVIGALRSGQPLAVDPSLVRSIVAVADVPRDDDLQLTLWTLYELHYRGFTDAPEDREWDPEVLRLRRELERAFEADLRRRVDPPPAVHDDFPGQLREVIETSDSPPLASHLHRHADREQVLSFLRQRSLFHLKESDPHSLVLARIDGPAKVALAELLYDEFGAGRPDGLHSKLFADALQGAGLDPAYGAYVDETPASTLAVNNLMSLLCLHRRWRGAALGHFAAFETTSSVPSRRIAGGIERVGLPAVVAAYFHEHVEADAVHEHVAVDDICGSLVAADPALADDVLFGAAACLALDVVAGEDLLGSWAGDRELGTAS